MGAPITSDSAIIDVASSRSLSDRTGFVEFGCDQLLGATSKAVRRELIIRAARTLKTISVVKAKATRRKA